MKQYLLIIGFSVLAGATVYGLTNEQDPYILIERQNREDILECTDKLDSFTGSSQQLQKELEKCSKIQLKTITWTSTPDNKGVPPKWYTAKHSLVLSGSHDYRIYSARNGAVWKNNNPSGITWWVSNVLKWLWDERWIDYKIWTARPKKEWWNYVLFWTIEHGLRAKVISIRERWWKATVAQYLWWWGTDYVKLSFPISKKISELSDEEFAELFIQQMKKESPGLTTQLVNDWILLIYN